MTAPSRPAATHSSAVPQIIEVKRQLDGSEQRYACALVHRGAGVVILRFHLERPPWDPALGPLDSYGCFWPRRSYGLYHMVRPADGAERVTRFDVLRDVDISDPAEVGYTDLLLDLWTEPATPGHSAVFRWDDDDEVAAAAALGTLATADRAIIERTRRLLGARHRRIVSEVRAMLRRVGQLPDGS